jgi:hypothetical protein
MAHAPGRPASRLCAPPRLRPSEVAAVGVKLERSDVFACSSFHAASAATGKPAASTSTCSRSEPALSPDTSGPRRDPAPREGASGHRARAYVDVARDPHAQAVAVREREDRRLGSPPNSRLKILT